MNQYNLPQGLEPHLSRYNKFIDSRLKRELSSVCSLEKHHIFPKSLGGEDEENNIIYLTLREHYIAHLILYKCYKGKMLYTFNMMSNFNKYGKRLTARQYKVLREEFVVQHSKRIVSKETSDKISKTRKERGIAKGKNNPRYGKHCTEETKEKIRRTEIGELSVWYGVKRSEEVCRKISESKEIPVLCIETNIVYTSSTAAGEILNIGRRHIQDVCIGKRHTCGGYHWRYP